jgi:hypothetical protein
VVPDGRLGTDLDTPRLWSAIIPLSLAIRTTSSPRRIGSRSCLMELLVFAQPSRRAIEQAMGLGL